MYQSGQVLVYGPHGACRVLELQHQQQGGRPVTYLVLEPLGQTGARYMVPIHDQVAMAKLRPLMTREELEDSRRLRSLRRPNGSGMRGSVSCCIGN